MRALISKSSLKGRAEAPSSKSYTLRGLMCAALASGQSEISRPLISDDTEAAREVLEKIGVGIQQDAGSWLVSGGHFHQPDSDLFCRDSAGTLRFMTAICSLIPGRCRLTAGPSLSKRPVKPLLQALQRLGVNCFSPGDAAAVIVEGGQLKGGTVELPGDISSQFISAILFISPLTEDGMTIRLTTPLKSKPYILMTLDCMQSFGAKVELAPDMTRFAVERQAYKPARYTVEGDWSSASYLLSLGAVAGETEVVNLNPESRQGDREILNLFKNMGASIHVGQDLITVKKSNLKTVKADLSDCIDLLPTMAALAAVADGVSEFTGISRARLKESDRVAAVKEGLERMDIEVIEGMDRLTIKGASPKGAIIDSKGDHRIAMAFSIPGILAGETIIENAECVSKTYPRFWDTLKSLGGDVNLHGK